jgi:hypothetical protein
MLFRQRVQRKDAQAEAGGKGVEVPRKIAKLFPLQLQQRFTPIELHGFSGEKVR